MEHGSVSLGNVARRGRVVTRQGGAVACCRAQFQGDKYSCVLASEVASIIVSPLGVCVGGWGVGGRRSLASPRTLRTSFPASCMTSTAPEGRSSLRYVVSTLFGCSRTSWYTKGTAAMPRLARPSRPCVWGANCTHLGLLEVSGSEQRGCTSQGPTVRAALNRKAVRGMLVTAGPNMFLMV